MSVIAIDAAMEHTYANTEDFMLIQRALDAAEDRAKDFLQRQFYADDADLIAAIATVPTLRSDARAAYASSVETAEEITDQDVREEAKTDARRILDNALSEAQKILNGIVIKPSIVAACLLITGHLYANREDVVIGTTSSQLPSGAESLLWPSRVGIGI